MTADLRERISTYGAATLANADLLAYLTGCEPAAAADRLDAAGGLRALTLAVQNEPATTDGAARLRAAVELATRLAAAEVNERLPLGNSAAVARYLTLRYATLDQEVMGVLLLDSRNRLIADRELFRGAMARAVAEPRRILREAILAAAAGVIVFHTHPSGDPSPSAEDMAFTRRLKDAGEVVGCRLLDHLILGAVGRWVSLRERGEV